tara:strand:- start:326 stop:526 length:201 start_codon:yes stop_codon:yes gene_type:complete
MTKQNKQDSWAFILDSIMNLLPNLKAIQGRNDALAGQLEKAGIKQDAYKQKRKANQGILGPMKINK